MSHQYNSNLAPNIAPNFCRIILYLSTILYRHHTFKVNIYIYIERYNKYFIYIYRGIQKNMCNTATLIHCL